MQDETGEPIADRTWWEAVVSGRRVLTSVQAAFNRTESRTEILAEALRKRGWDELAALTFLDSFVADVPLLLDELMELVGSPRRGYQVRQLIERCPPSSVVPQFDDIIPRLLSRSDADAHDYGGLAELFVRMDQWSWLDRLIALGRDTNDPEIHDVVEHYAQTYRPSGGVGCGHETPLG